MYRNWYFRGQPTLHTTLTPQHPTHTVFRAVVYRGVPSRTSPTPQHLIQYRTVQYRTVPYSVLYRIPFRTVPYCAVPYSAVFRTVLYRTLFSRTFWLRALATEKMVMSSCVGPTPPEVMTTSNSCTCRRTCRHPAECEIKSCVLQSETVNTRALYNRIRDTTVAAFCWLSYHILLRWCRYLLGEDATVARDSLPHHYDTSPRCRWHPRRPARLPLAPPECPIHSRMLRPPESRETRTRREETHNNKNDVEIGPDMVGVTRLGVVRTGVMW